MDVFFDESGYTGNNLLDVDQPTFVAAALAIDYDRATAVVSESRERFGLAPSELKGSKLCRYPKGRQATTWILDQIADYQRTFVIDKRYALAGKFYEYAFEPCFSSCNSLFYAIGFHYFISNWIHCESIVGNSPVQNVLEYFATMMREPSHATLERVLSGLGEIDPSSPTFLIKEFTTSHRQALINEIDRVATSEFIASWSLELSMTSLHWLLASLGEEYDQLSVYCDESKPLESSKWFFNNFVGRSDKHYMPVFGDKTPSYVYNLAKPINFVDSASTAGVQLADVVASSLAYSLKRPDEPWANECADRLLAQSRTISPDLTWLDFDDKRVMMNAVTLIELVARSKRDEELCDGMEEFLLATRTSLM